MVPRWTVYVVNAGRVGVGIAVGTGVTVGGGVQVSGVAGADASGPHAARTMLPISAKPTIIFRITALSFR
jgi:hypothetical protein